MNNIGIRQYRKVSTRICEFCPVAKNGPRELCQYCEYGMPQAYPIKLQVEPQMRSPVALGLTGKIYKITIAGQVGFELVSGSPVFHTVSIPAGDYFDVTVNYDGRGLGGLIPSWATCATMIGPNGALANYDVTQEWGQNASGIMKLDANGQPGPMPSSALTLRVTLWGYPTLNVDPPPQSLW